MPTKKMILLFMSLLLSACTSSKPQPYLLDITRSEACQKELNIGISTLINAKNLSISEDVFSEKAFLYVTNQKEGILKEAIIINDLNGRKKILLYKKNKRLYLGIKDRLNNLSKSQELKKCLDFSNKLSYPK